MVGDCHIGDFGAQGTGCRADAAAQQHKRRLPHCCGHIHGGIIRIGQQQSALGTACSGLNHIAGELFEQSFRRGNAAGVRRVQVGLVAKIERCFAVLQAAQGVAQQATGGFVRRNKQAALFQQGIQRGLGQGGILKAIAGIAKAGAQFLHPLFAVFIRHCLGGG